MSREDPFTEFGGRALSAPAQEFLRQRQGPDPFAEFGGRPLASEPAPTLMESRRAASASEFEQNQPQSTVGTRAREMAIGLLQPFDLHNVPQLVESVGGALWDAMSGKGTARAQELVRGAIAGQVEPIRETVQGLASGDYDTLARGVGGTIGTAAQLFYGGEKAGIPQMVEEAAPGVAIRFENVAAKSMERALAPGAALEMKGITQRIAPLLAKKKLSGLTGDALDRNILAQLKTSGEAVQAAEAAIPKNAVTPKQPILANIDDAIAELQIPGKAGQAVSGHPDAIAALNKLREDIDNLPDDIPTHDLIRLRRQYDKAIADAGGYKETGTVGEKTAMRAKQDVADFLRMQIGEAHPSLAQANAEFSLFSDASKIVKRRDLADVGTRSPLAARVGRWADDVVALTLGQAIGGPVGAGTAEAINLLRQSRGAQAMKARLSQTAADVLRERFKPHSERLRERISMRELSREKYKPIDPSTY